MAKENKTIILPEKGVRPNPAAEPKVRYELAQTPANWVPAAILLGALFTGVVVEIVSYARSRARSKVNNQTE